MAWVVSGNLRGPKGDPGEPGQDGAPGADGASGASGVPGASGERGPEGPPGQQGEPGLSLEVAGTLTDHADLPANPKPGTAYIINGLLYIADASGWPADGAGVAFQGPEGPRGPEGPPGASGAAGQDGSDGVDGQDGAPGEKGDQGERGSLWFSGDGVPSGITGAQPQDKYIDLQTGDVYSFS